MENLIILQLDFEKFFLKKQEKNFLTFDDFINFFDSMLFNELMKIHEKLELEIDDVYDTLNEKYNFNHSLSEIVELESLLKNEKIKIEYEKLKENLFKNPGKSLFLEISKHKSTENQFKSALNLAFQLLKKKYKKIFFFNIYKTEENPIQNVLVEKFGNFLLGFWNLLRFRKKLNQN